MAEGDTYHGYLTVLHAAGRLPGATELGFRPMNLTDAVRAMVAEAPFAEDARIDTHDRLDAWHHINSDDGLRSRVGEADLNRLLATSLGRRHQMELRTHSALHPEEISPELRASGLGDLWVEDPRSLGLTDEELDVDREDGAREWADGLLAASAGERRDAVAALSSWIGAKRNSGSLFQEEIDTGHALLPATVLEPAALAGIVTEVRCEDDYVVVDSGPPAVKITTSFVTNTPVHGYTAVSDPKNWPKCHPSFFKRMDDLGHEKDHLWNPPKGYTGTEGILDEEVAFDFALFEIPLRTYLRCVVFKDVDEAGDIASVGMTFDFAGSQDGRIDVDHGFMLAQRRVGDRNTTEVSSQKTVRFRIFPNILARLACELGWAMMMRKMASCQIP